jgi:hypothetical protein
MLQIEARDRLVQEDDLAFAAARGPPGVELREGSREMDALLLSARQVLQGSSGEVGDICPPESPHRNPLTVRSGQPAPHAFEPEPRDFKDGERK